MFDFRKHEEVPEMEVAELIKLNEKLDEIIINWVNREIGTGIEPGSKLGEILVFNFKIFYEPSETATELRQYLIKPNTPGEKIEYLFSRLQDLYIVIKMMFPCYFIKSIQQRHIDTIKRLGYQVDDEIVTQYEYGWLFLKIQHILMYQFQPIK